MLITPQETPADTGPDFVSANADGSVTVDPSKIPAEAPKVDPKARPADLPEGYESWADVAKELAELKKAPAAKPEVKPAETVKIATPEETTAAVKAAGLDLDALSAEFKEKGALSEESLTALSEKGIKRDVVDAYIASQKAQADVFTNQLAEIVGGRENLDALIGWAGTGLSAEEIGTYNRLLASNDIGAAKMALVALQSLQADALGSSPARVNSAAKGQSGTKPFASEEEALAAMRDPKYNTDRAYRAKVAARLEVSSVFSIG